MSNKTKMRLSGNSIAWAGSFVNRFKTNHNSTYNRKITLLLVHKFCRGNWRTCERHSFC